MNNIKTKTLADFLTEDKNLNKKITHEEYEEKINAPQNNDHSIKSVIENFGLFKSSIEQDE